MTGARMLLLFLALSFVVALVFAVCGDFGGFGVLGAQLVFLALVGDRARRSSRRREPAPWA
jgi:hypothetical protein